MMSSSLTTTRMSREEFKKAKELEELRKSGAAPPEVDPEGKMINPHIPQYISQSPWYLNNSKPGLRHQTLKSFSGTEVEAAPGIKKASFTEYYQRGKTAGPAPTKFVAGSCTNCGSSTHVAKDCVERPRKKGAALTGENIQAPELIQKMEFSYDAKRDRWNGYDTREYSKIIRRFELTETERKKKNLEELDAEFELARQEERKQKEEEEKAKASAAGGEPAAAAAASAADGSNPPVAAASSSTPADEADEKSAKDTEARRLRVLKKQERLKKAIRKAQKASSANNPGGGHNDSDSDSDSDAGSDSDDDEDMKDFGEVHQKKDTNARMTVRNLRIREDRAKYLLNLDINSAHYDPKTRSMRENPYENKDPKELMYAGDNFVRKQGLTGEMQAMQSFVWESNERGNEGVHVQALPSQAEKLFQEYKDKKEQLKNTRKAAIMEKYGDANGGAGDNQMKAPKELLMPVSESYTEYDETGKVIKGVEAAIPRTKYVEDQYENGHKAIWGSFWKAGSWGYACCHQTIRHAICTGEAGKEAARSMADQLNSRQSFKEVKEAKEAAAASDASNTVPPAAATAAAVPPAATSSSSAAEPAVKQEFEVDDEDARMLAAELARKRKRRDEKRKSSRSRSRSNSSSSSSGSDSNSSSGSDSSSSSSSSEYSSSSSSESDDDDRKHRKKRSKDKKKKKRSSRSRRSRSRSRSRSNSRDKKRRKKEDKSTAPASSSSSSHISAAARINSKGYNSSAMDFNHEPTQEEMDSYLLQKHNKSHEDPLLNMPKDALLEQ